MDWIVDGPSDIRRVVFFLVIHLKSCSHFDIANHLIQGHVEIIKIKNKLSVHKHHLRLDCQQAMFTGANFWLMAKATSVILVYLWVPLIFSHMIRSMKSSYITFQMNFQSTFGKKYNFQNRVHVLHCIFHDMAFKNLLLGPKDYVEECGLKAALCSLMSIFLYHKNQFKSFLWICLQGNLVALRVALLSLVQ